MSDPSPSPVSPVPAPIARDDAADTAALEALRQTVVAAEQAQQQPVQPASNVMLHQPRALTDWQNEKLALLKDIALVLNNELHTIDGSEPTQPEFYARELDQAALKLEECLLWAEKHFRL